MEQKKNTVSFFDILITLARHKRFILTTVISISLAALIVSLIWPKKYLSSSEIVQSRESIGQLGGLLENIGSISTGQSKVGGETILIILNSQELKDSLIKEFNLEEVYDINIKEALYERLKGVIEVEEVREGGFGFNPIVSVKIRVIDEEPERAQAMNQFILSELEKKMENINTNATQENLKIIEERFRANQEELAEAEQQLNSFQNKYGILEVSSQLEALISNLAELKTSVIQKEVELDVMSSRLDANSNQLIMAKQELQSMKNKYMDLVEVSDNISQVSDSFYPLFDMPDLMLQYARLYREVEIQNTIYEMLIPQLEQQKLFLANKSSGIRLIDPADLPTYKNSPKRAFIVLGGFFFSIFLSLFVVFIRELQADENSEYSQKIDILKKELRFRKNKE